AQLVGRKIGGAVPGSPATGLGAIETRLTGVVVAALKEAFDRDRDRMELERAQIDAERRRAEQALQAELRRQTVDRALGELRTVGAMALGVWMLSAVLALWLPHMRAIVPRTLLGCGWACAFASLGCAFAGGRHISRGTTGAPEAISAPATAIAAPWFLLSALALVGASLLVGM